MPFDPPFVDAGATIGGTIAAGVSGSCRLRAGGVRDFIIGVRIVDGTGAHVRGGGRVVKNAAGFDIPRLMVGSMGRLGIICEATFKVFPAPLAWCTLRISCSDLTDAINCTADLAMKPFELEALDIEPPRTVVARVGGEPASLARHAERVGRSTNRRFEIMTGAGEASYWRDQREFSWHAQDHWLIRMPLRPDDVLALDARLDEAGITRRYAVAANVAWFSWHGARHLDDLDPGGLHGQIVRGPPCPSGPLIGTGDFLAGAFGRRIIDALDPDRRLPSFKAV
jgi:glycolate oxidase FAD binding subunit